MIIEKVVFNANTEYRNNTLVLDEKIALIPDDNAFNRIKELFCSSLFMTQADIDNENKHKDQLENIKIEITNQDSYNKLVKGELPANCIEYLNCRVLSKNNCDYKNRLKSYIYPNEYYQKGDFEKITNNYGTLTFFQSYIKTFIKEYKEIIINKELGIYLCLNRDGEFSAKKDKKGIDISIELNKDDYKIFQFLCFIEINRFWDEIDEIISYSPLHIPLMISDIVDVASPDNINFLNALQFAKSYKNQIIVCG